MQYQLSSLWKLDHIGHAVNNLAVAEEFYSSVLGFKLAGKEVLAEQELEISFMQRGETLIELLAPKASTPNSSSPLVKFLAKRGEGTHHICYRVESVAEELLRLKSLNLRLIDEKPRLGSRNLEVAFIHPSSCHGMLIELCGTQTVS